MTRMTGSRPGSAAGRGSPLVLFAILAGGLAFFAHARGYSLFPGESLDPCTTALEWHIAEVDPRFGITPEEARRAVDEAAAVWEGAAGRDLFRHEPESGMAVRLVYDARQEAFQRWQAAQEEVARLDARVEEHRRTLEELRAGLRARRSPGGAADSAAAFQRDVERYNEEVDRFNRAVAERNAAVQQVSGTDTLHLRAGDLRSETRAIGNRVVSVHRTLTVGLVAGYEELVLVLAHELGHALGIDHVPEPYALMAARYQSRDAMYPVTLGAGDLEALALRCSSAR